MFNTSSTTKRMVTLALLLALEIFLSRFLSIATPTLKIGFSFFPIAIAAMLYGPLYGGLVGGLGDFIGANLFAVGAYFPGFTVTGFLTGVVYGVFLHKQPKNPVRVLCAALVVCLLLNLCLNTLWLQIYLGKAFWVLLPPRLVNSLVMVPIQFLFMYTVPQRMLKQVSY